MEVKKMSKVFFSVGLVLVLTLSHQQVLAHKLNTGEAIAKSANTTLHVHDEVELHELIHKIFKKKMKGYFLNDGRYKNLNYFTGTTN